MASATALSAIDKDTLGESTETRPAVSIIVPCYNGGRYLDNLMAALDRQTFRDFEIVIIDDGSTDDLTMRKFAELEGRARVIHQPNRGLPAARNAGARAARADILFMHDCDDTIEPTHLAETVPVLQAAPADVGMVTAHMRLVGAQSGIVRRYLSRFDLLFTNTIGACVVVRKACWGAVGGYDEAMRDGYEDWDFSLKLVEAGCRCLEIAKPLYNYRIASDDQTSSLMTSIHARRMYAKLWRQLREKHPQSYRLPAMIRLWWISRQDCGRTALWKGLGGYVLALALPDAAFNKLFIKFHRQRMRVLPRAMQT
jgi:hypothetical protein